MVSYSYAWFEDIGIIFGFSKVPRKGHFWLFLVSFTVWRACRHLKLNLRGQKFLLWVADMVWYSHEWSEDSGTILGFFKVPRMDHFWLLLESFTIWRACRHLKHNPLGLKSLLRVADMVCYSHGWSEDSGTIFGFLKVPRKSYFWLFLASLTVRCAHRHPKCNPLELKF